MPKVLKSPFLSMFLGSVEYSGCQYEDGDEITGKSGIWEASKEKVTSDTVTMAVTDQKLSKKTTKSTARVQKKTKIK